MSQARPVTRKIPTAETFLPRILPILPPTRVPAPPYDMVTPKIPPTDMVPTKTPPADFTLLRKRGLARALTTLSIHIRGEAERIERNYADVDPWVKELVGKLKSLSEELYKKSGELVEKKPVEKKPTPPTQKIVRALPIRTREAIRF